MADLKKQDLQISKICKYKKVAICGYREYGRILYEILKELQIEVPYIIERNYESLRVTEKIEVPIVGFNEKNIYANAEVLIITSDLDYKVVEECLELAGITVPRLLLADLIME